MSLTHCRTLFFLGAMASVGFPVVAAPPDKPSDRQVARWIKQLGDSEFAVREKASRQLWLAGEAAEAALEKALRSDDPEVVRRARAILDNFRWGIYGDTPAKVVALIQAYKSIDVEDGFDEELVSKLLDSDIIGLRAVLQFAKNDKDSQRRNRLRELVFPRMLGDLQKVFDKVEDKTQWDKFVTLAYDGVCLAEKHFAAYWLLRGRLDHRIRHFRARLAKDPSDKRSAHTLAYLYRAKCDLVEARKIAEKENFDDLLVDILLRMADWKALASRPKPMGLDPIDQATYRASFARMSGNRKQFEAALADLKNLSHGQEAYDAGLAFIANGRPLEGIKLLAGSERHKHFAFLVLCSRLQYREAIALVDRTPADDPSRKMLEIHQARMWYHLGEPDKGRALFARLGDQLAEGRNSYWSERLLRVEHALGLNDLALEHCALLLPLPQPKRGWSPSANAYLSEIFRGKGEAVWYPLLRRKFREEPDLRVLRRVQDLFEGKIAKATVKEWIEKAQKELDSLKEAERSRQLIAFAEVAHSAGLDDLAGSLLEKADTDEAWIRLGDLFADKQKWKQTAECYRRAWRKDLLVEDWLGPGVGVDPLPLYLAGDALVKAGREREGEKLIEQAHLAPLGNAGSRYSFFASLRERGHQKAARRELFLMARLAEANPRYADYSFDRVMYHLARTAAARKDYFRAAQAYEQAMFSDLELFQVWFGPVGAARTSSEIHRLRAFGLLAAGKHEEASREIDLALIASPANTEVANALVPELERRGRKKEADALFDRCLDAHERICRDYPRCAQRHNKAAWMSACCRRNLDKALQHAEKAVELAPKNAGYLDTLAEVHFQRGDKDKAIALQKRAIELDPKKAYFRKQLKRLEAGDPSAERPPENEEE